MEFALIIVNCALTVGVFVLLLARRGASSGADATGGVAPLTPELVDQHFRRMAEALGTVEARLRDELRRGEKAAHDSAAAQREEHSKAANTLREEQRVASTALRTELDAKFSTQLRNTLERLDAVKATLDQQLQLLRTATNEQITKLNVDNQKKLDEMRGVVDEKLQATLQARLGEAFKQVSERLEQVHKGLGEMQTIATEVGGLKRVLSNVKSRGILGEVQLATILEQFLTPDQLSRNVETAPGSGKRVEFAVRMPGRDDDHPVLLPIDAKFPKEDYERLLDAQERADPVAAEAAAAGLAAQLHASAKDIRTKYVDPPHTTDFAILFVPTEGLYAEVLRRPGLSDELQNTHRIIVAGPTTLAALLQSLQMGFRTLALEKRSSEVWTLLGAVKTEFEKFGDVLKKAKRQLDAASNTLDHTSVRTRAITRTLKNVHALPADQASLLLPGAGDAAPAEDGDGEDEAPE